MYHEMSNSYLAQALDEADSDEPPGSGARCQRCQQGQHGGTEDAEPQRLLAAEALR